MRALLQRVSSASVEVEGERISAIGPGLLVLLGVEVGDDEQSARWLAEKTVGLRIFEDAEGKMNRSLSEVGGELLAVSQFTLCADASRGRRPSFIRAMEPLRAHALYERYCSDCRALGVKVSEGRFRAEMRVALVNEGPVTLSLESPQRTPKCSATAKE